MERFVILHNTTGEYLRSRTFPQKLFSGGSPVVLHFWNSSWDSTGARHKLVSFPTYEMALKWFLIQSNIPGIKEKVMFATVAELETVPKAKYFYKRISRVAFPKIYAAKLSEFEIMSKEFTEKEFNDEYYVQDS